MACVYFWLRENGTPYYVGYGSYKTRAYARHPRSNGDVPKPPTERIHIHTYEDKHRAKLREWELINFLKPMLLNVCSGYSTAHAFYGEDNHFYGKHHTEESKKKMSEAKKGKKIHSKEWRDYKAELMKGNQNNKGRKWSDETKAKISASCRGKKRTPEQKARYAEAARKRWARARGEEV